MPYMHTFPYIHVSVCYLYDSSKVLLWQISVKQCLGTLWCGGGDGQEQAWSKLYLLSTTIKYRLRKISCRHVHFCRNREGWVPILWMDVEITSVQSNIQFHSFINILMTIINVKQWRGPSGGHHVQAWVKYHFRKTNNQCNIATTSAWNIPSVLNNLVVVI